MKSEEKKCEKCGEVMEEITYANGSSEDTEKFGPGESVIQCKNYENCPKYKNKN